MLINHAPTKWDDPPSMCYYTYEKPEWSPIDFFAPMKDRNFHHWKNRGVPGSQLQLMSRWWQLKYFVFSPWRFGEDSHFDKHIFQMSWFSKPPNQNVHSLKLTAKAPENRPSISKETSLVFQPSMTSGAKNMWLSGRDIYKLLQQLKESANLNLSCFPPSFLKALLVAPPKKMKMKSRDSDPAWGSERFSIVKNRV